jgi:hypothetical protein
MRNAPSSRRVECRTPKIIRDIQSKKTHGGRSLTSEFGALEDRGGQVLKNPEGPKPKASNGRSVEWLKSRRAEMPEVPKRRSVEASKSRSTEVSKSRSKSRPSIRRDTRQKSANFEGNTRLSFEFPEVRRPKIISVTDLQEPRVIKSLASGKSTWRKPEFEI